MSAFDATIELLRHCNLLKAFPSKLCMHEACMRHASKLAHLHAFSCMHASGMKICMHVTSLEQLIMHENACMLKFGDSGHRQQSRFRVRGS